MKKFLLWGGLAAVVLVVGSLVIGYLVIGKAVTHGVNTLAPKFTGTTVVLDDTVVSPLTGTGELHGLTIGNPDGWKGDVLMSMGKARLSISPASLLTDTIVIKEITLEAPEFHYQTAILSSNLGDLLKNIEKAAGGKQADGSPQPAEPGAQKKLIIERIVLKDAKVSLGLAGAALPVAVPDLEFKDIGVKEGGLPPVQVALEMGKQVLPHIITSAVKALGSLETTKGIETIKGAAKSVGDGIKSLFGGKKDEGKK